MATTSQIQIKIVFDFYFFVDKFKSRFAKSCIFTNPKTLLDNSAHTRDNYIKSRFVKFRFVKTGERNVYRQRARITIF